MNLAITINSHILLGGGQLFTKRPGTLVFPLHNTQLIKNVYDKTFPKCNAELRKNTLNKIMLDKNTLNNTLPYSYVF